MNKRTKKQQKVERRRKQHISLSLSFLSSLSMNISTSPPPPSIYSSHCTSADSDFEHLHAQLAAPHLHPSPATQPATHWWQGYTNNDTLPEWGIQASYLSCLLAAGVLIALTANLRVHYHVKRHILIH